MVKEVKGFREKEHTADWELEVWAPDLPGLLEQAALGMYSLSKTRLQVEKCKKYKFKLTITDQESLLVSFLSELLYLGEQKGVAFDRFNIKKEGSQLQVEAWGAPIISQEKEIKAVTYHNLKIRETERGLETNIVFDV